MSPSLPRLPLDRSVREALATAVKLKLPPGTTPTLEAYEAAAVAVLRELGPQMLEDAMLGVDQDPKKGALLGAAVAPPSSKASAAGRSSR